MKIFCELLPAALIRNSLIIDPGKPLPQIAGECKTGACRRQNALLNCYALAISGKQIGYEKISA
jgi:hypothetical protein